MVERASEGELAEYLNQIATERMGMSQGDWLLERSAQTARALVALRPTFELH
jgi:hypothetical protein